MMADDAKGEDEDELKMIEPRGEASLGIIRTMGKYSRELCFVMGVIFTAFAAFQNGPLRTRKANPPEKFFSPSALVADYEQGNLADLTSRLLENDVSFVMYYAPWDAQSLNARSEFQILARYYHFQVFFAAINCWWPEGQCHQYHKLQGYPLLVAHIRRTGEIPYRGPLIASYMIAFLDHVLNPIVPVQHEGEILDLQTQHNAVLLGFFDFHRSPQPPGYKEYHIASLKALKQDPWRQVTFAVISNKKSAENLKMKDNSSIVLYMWNSTEAYTGKQTDPEEMVQWVYSNLKQVTQWINFPIAKSKLLSQLLETAPTLILFTPRSLVFGISPYYDMMREVAMDYYNCQNDAQVTSIIHRSVLRRHLLHEKFIELQDRCEEAKLWENTTVNETLDFPEGDACCQSMVLSSEQSIFTRNCFCMACVHYNKEKCPSGCKKFNCIGTASRFLYNFKFDDLQSSFAKCGDVRTSYQPKYTPYYFISLRCFSKDPHISLEEDESGLEVGLHGLKDDKITTMIRHFKKEHCSRLDLGLNYSGLNFPDMPTYDSAVWSSAFTGLGCARNYSILRFAGIDSVQFHPFAERLGVNVRNETHQTFAVIIDAEKESQYVQKGGINKKILVEFIKNYTASLLDRHLRSFGDRVGCSDEEGNEVVCVTEVSSRMFRKIVLDPNKDVVILYYAPWCGLCTSISHIYLTVAKFFSQVKDIAFARINGDANDLPWEYTVDRYPTLLFFPAQRKAESNQFPPDQQITVANLVQFVITNAHPKVRWQVALEVCSRKCLISNLLRSWSELRHLFLQVRRHRNHLAFFESYLLDIAIPRSPRRRRSVQESQEEMLREYIRNLVQQLTEEKQKIKKMRLLMYFLRKQLESIRSGDIFDTGVGLDMLLFFDQLEDLSDFKYVEPVIQPPKYNAEPEEQEKVEIKSPAKVTEGEKKADETLTDIDKEPKRSKRKKSLKHGKRDDEQPKQLRKSWKTGSTEEVDEEGDGKAEDSELRENEVQVKSRKAWKTGTTELIEDDDEDKQKPKDSRKNVANEQRIKSTEKLAEKKEESSQKNLKISPEGSDDRKGIKIPLPTSKLSLQASDEKKTSKLSSESSDDRKSSKVSIKTTGSDESSSQSSPSFKPSLLTSTKSTVSSHEATSLRNSISKSSSNVKSSTSEIDSDDHEPLTSLKSSKPILRTDHLTNKKLGLSEEKASPPLVRSKLKSAVKGKL